MALSLLTPTRLMLWGAALCVLSWFIHLHTTLTPGLVDRVGRFKGSDYVQFYVMGSLVHEGRTGDLYEAHAHLSEGRRRIHPDLRLYAAHPNYGPQVALAFVPLALLPYGWSLAVFLGLSLVCYAFSVWIVWRDCAALRGHGWLVAVLAAGSPLLLTVVRYGQASAFALLALALAFAAFRRQRLFLAGFAIGCLAYKPQLGVLFAIVLVAARQWRVVGGAAAAVGAQLAIAWITAGSQSMMRYGAELWLLALNPQLIAKHASELHSVRGFVNLLVPNATIVTVCGVVALIAAIALAIRTWSSAGPLSARFGALIVLTILASPHLISYDLLLLTLPLLLFADWAAQHADHRYRAAVSLSLVLLYFAPFSGMIVARLIGVQISVPVMMLLAWWMYQVSIDSRAMVAPRCEPVSSQNSTTREWRSSAA
jgi:alpha-1,2-mannosyltransferase